MLILLYIYKYIYYFIIIKYQKKKIFFFANFSLIIFSKKYFLYVVLNENLYLKITMSLSNKF